MKKYFWITNLRVFATLTVIVLHAAAGGIYHLGSIPDSWWWICNTMNCFGRFAVPVFFMLSGYLLLGKYDGDLSTFLKKRLTRIFIPFVVWTIIYMLWGNYNGFANETTSFTFLDISKKFLTGGAGGSGHLWFLYSLLGLYAFTPILSKWLKNASDFEIRFFLILWAISSAGYTIIDYFFKIQIKFDLHNFSGYVGYFVLGYYLGTREFSISPKNLAIISGISFLLSWIVIDFGLFFFTQRKHNIYDSTLFDYLSPFAITMCISAFIFFKNALNIPIIPNIMNRLDVASYGMYLMHLIPLRYLSREYQINYTWHNPFIGIMTQFLLTSIICFVLIFILSKIPKGNWITG